MSKRTTVSVLSSLWWVANLDTAAQNMCKIFTSPTASSWSPLGPRVCRLEPSGGMPCTRSGVSSSRPQRALPFFIATASLSSTARRPAEPNGPGSTKNNERLALADRAHECAGTAATAGSLAAVFACGADHPGDEERSASALAEPGARLPRPVDFRRAPRTQAAPRALKEKSVGTRCICGCEVIWGAVSGQPGK